MSDRFQFPGFTSKGTQDTLIHQVEMGTINVGGNAIVLHLIRSIDALERNPHLTFMPAQILRGSGEVIWSFKRTGWDGIGLLAMAGDEPAIAFVKRGPKGKVDHTLTIAEIISGTPIQNVRRRLELKRKAAGFLGREYDLTQTESAVVRHLSMQKITAAKAEEAERLAKEAFAREDRIRRIKARPEIFGFTEEGKPRRGLPVVGNEWQSLDSGAFVIVVTFYDEKTKAPGELVESFQVHKSPGRNPSKIFAKAVTVTQPILKSSGPVLPQSVGTVAIAIGDDFIEVEVYGSMDDVQKLRVAGLNGGTYVGVGPKVGPFTVYCVFTNKVETVGDNIMPL